jgi:glycogen debranching enzyme
LTNRLRYQAEGVLRAGWREGRRADGTPFGFTCPAPRRYPHQWYWDSCFHAIVWRHFDPGRAREELRTLVRAMSPEGLVPHTIFWAGRARWRRAPFYATASPLGSFATAHTQTPMLALAWELVAGGDHEFEREGIAPLARHYDWLARDRDPDGDGLVAILLPDESGLDDSPKYDPVYGRFSHYRPGYFRLVERHRRRAFSAHAMADRFDHHLEDVVFNVVYALSLRALHRMSGEARFLGRAERAQAALMDRCWDEGRGLFFDLAGRSERRIQVSTWSSLAPLALPALPERVRRRVVEEHLLDRRRYAAPVGIPSVSMEEPSFRAGFDRFRCWRGPSWVNTSWLLVPSLLELGYEEDAARIVRSLVHTLEREGFREYYNPLTGRGYGARDFGWSTLVVDL